MTTPARQGDLFDGASGPRTTIHVSTRCCLHVQDGHWVALGAGIPLLHFAEGDRMARAHAIVSIVEQEWATQVEAARAFGCTPRTVRRLIERFDAGGLRELGRRAGYPRGKPRRSARRAHLILRLKGQGLSNREVGGRLDISEKAVRKALRRLGWKAVTAPELPLGAEAASEQATVPASPAGKPVAGADPNLSAFGADPNLSASGADPNLSALGAHPNLSASDEVRSQVIFPQRTMP